MQLKFCSCWGCRHGRHRAGAKCRTRRIIRSNRRKTKVNLKNGVEPERIVSVPYTD